MVWYIYSFHFQTVRMKMYISLKSRLIVSGIILTIGTLANLFTIGHSLRVSDLIGTIMWGALLMVYVCGWTGYLKNVRSYKSDVEYEKVKQCLQRVVANFSYEEEFYQHIVSDDFRVFVSKGSGLLTGKYYIIRAVDLSDTFPPDDEDTAQRIIICKAYCLCERVLDVRKRIEPLKLTYDLETDEFEITNTDDADTPSDKDIHKADRLMPYDLKYASIDEMQTLQQLLMSSERE